MRRFSVISMLPLSFVGLADSAYLAQHESTNTPLICDIKNLSGCNIVASSEYSKIFGIPVANFGVVFYSVVFILVAAELAVANKTVRRAIQILAAAGLLFSGYSTFVQVYYIKALCIYCLGSAAVVLLISLFATRIEPLRKRTESIHIAPDASLPSHKGNLPMPPVS